MSFWQNGNQPDLSVTGTATSRHQRPPSGRRGRPNSAGRGGSTKSHIFGISDTPRPDETDKKPGSFHNNSTVSGSVYSNPEAPRVADGNPIKSVTTPLANASVITKSQLQATKNLAAQRDPSYADQPVEVQVFSQSGKSGRKAPLGVPQLQLGNLADDNNQLVNPLTAGHPHLHTPDSNSSVVSWGTPLPPNRRFQPGPGKPKHGGQQDRAKGSQATPSRIRPDDMPALDLEESQQADGLRQTLQAAKKDDKDCLQEHEVRFEKEPSKGESSYPNEKPLIDSNMTANQFNRPWSTQPATQREESQYRTREEQDVIHSEKKKDLVVEAVLLDQLSRAAVSDPQKCSTSIPIDVGPKQRKQMEFYNTRSPSRGPSAENALAKRVRFGARIVTKNGHDAHRELNGFFFSADSTLTIYEFHQFGTRASALPFIQRGCYSHVQGRKKGKQYNLLDVCMGSSLSFLTASQMSLPQNIRRSPVVLFRITDVDEQARKKQLLDSCHTLDDRRDLAEMLENPFSESEMEQLEILKNVQSIIKKQLQKRAVKTLMGLGQHFRKLDKSGDGVLDRSELQQALETYHIRVPDEASDYLWSILDINGDGFLDYGEFVRGFIGEMNELRKSYVRKVFRKLDPNKNGIVNLNNIRKFYCTKKHPKVLSGEAQERQIEDAFLSSFEFCEKNGQVTFAEFEDYYEGVSIGFESDEEFVAMLRNCWGV